MSRRRSGDAGAGIPRRLLLQALASSTVLLESACEQAVPEGASSVRLHAAYREDPADSPIQRENQLTGNGGFELAKPAPAGEVEVYASPMSVVAGDVVSVFVSTTQTQGVRLEVYRIGYYQGLGGRLVSSADPVMVSPQPAPVPDATTGLIECDWQVTFSLPVEPDWVTGYYVVKVVTDDGFEARAPFVVRESDRMAPLLAQASATTWQAYNVWGGLSLYHNETDNSQFGDVRAYQVSFDRPFLPDEEVWGEEWAMARWLEEKGYDVAYVTNMDLDAAPELLSGRQLFISVGHDEYWSLTARNAVQDARDQGLNIAFFSGNTAYRRIRLEPSSSGVERRIVTCYKSAELDPVKDARDTTADYADKPYPRPGMELLGLRWAGWAYLDGFPFLVANAEHWIYEGTGVRENDTLGHIIGYEWDTVGSGEPDGVEVVGDSPVVHEYGYASRSNAVVFYPTPTSFVFAAGTIGWARALSEPDLVNVRLQRVTQNILARAKLFPFSNAVAAQPRTSTSTSTGSPESAVIAGSGSRGNADDAALLAQFDSPAGVAAGLAGELYVSDTGNQLIRKISADGQVSTFLATGSSSSPTRVDTPTGIAVDANGIVYVSNTAGDRILSIDPRGKVAIFAGGYAGNRDASNRKNARFDGPRGLAFDASGALYVADLRNDAIRRIDSSGVSTVVTRAGGPSAIAVGPDGTVYYVATWKGAIVSVSPDGTSTTLANVAAAYGDRIGPGATAQLRPMDGLLYTPAGLVFSDTGNNRIRFLAFDAQNTVTDLLGDGDAGAGAGPDSAGQVVLPRGLAPFNGGYVVADSMNHRILWFGPTAS